MIKRMKYPRLLMMVLACSLVALLSACAGQSSPEPSSPDDSKTPAPASEEAAPEPTPAGYATEEEAIQAWLEANVPSLANAATIEVDATDGDFARARITPNEGIAIDPSVAYLQRVDGLWTVLTIGTAFGPDFYKSYSIPPSLHLEAPQGLESAPQGLMAQCSAVQALMEPVVGQVSLEEGQINDPMSGTTGTGCQLRTAGNGVQFEDFVTLANDLRVAMNEAGWEEDMMYAADGPTATATAFRQGETLAMLNVGWQPAAEANCPQDQPISECELTPEQQLYTITMNLMESAPVQ